MWPLVMVCPKPLCREQLSMLDAVEAVQIQPLVPGSSIESLDVGILGRFTGLDVQQGDLLLSCPVDQFVADVFRAVVAAQSQWFLVPLDDPLQRANDAFAGQ